MSRRFGLDPEQQRRQTQAHLLMLRVGLALLDDARRLGGFETDEKRLSARTAELVAELVGVLPADPPGDEAPVQAIPLDADRVLLSASYEDSTSVGATLRTDGVLLDEGVTIGVSLEPVDESELSPEELEQMREEMAKFEAEQKRPQFGGGRFLRALAVEPQPGSEVQVLAAELFEDGLIVHHSFNREPGSLKSIASMDPAEWPETEPRLRVEDDLGTEYYPSGGAGAGGVQVAHGGSAFAPAVPGAARTLRISSDSGTVELPLQCG